jgi:RNA polymerase sigma factor (TIGR02999 family)
MRTITELLEASRSGDAAAESKVFDAVYQDLRAIAHRHLHKDRALRLQTTSLVHETYLKLANGQALDFRDRAHLLCTASRAMRRILVDRARALMSEKHGSGASDLPLEYAVQLADVDLHDKPAHLLALDDALDKLSAFNARMAQLVELKFFGGFELTEIEPMLEVSERTLKRDWRVARAFLYDAMHDEFAH